MCWSARVSLNTFLLAAFSVTLGMTNRVLSPWNAAFMMTYSSMQLVEYFLWTNITNPARNRLWSMIGFCALLAQPLISILRLRDGPELRRWRAYLLAAFGAYLAFLALVVTKTDTIRFETKVATNGHLQWRFLPPSLAIILPWMLLFFAPMVLMKSYVGMGLTLFILCLSIATYWKDGTWGSMWCWVGAAWSSYYIVRAFCTAGVCAKLQL